MQSLKLSIEINQEFQRAIDLVENSEKNLLIFGKAGTGKSTFLNYFREHTKKEIVVLAPTGVAAINISGMTIHSFFGFFTDITLEKVKKVSPHKPIIEILKKIDTIIIDEISMVRADLLDCVDKFLQLNGPKRNQPFGGIQMIFIGDLYQIPPVVKSDLTKYFSDVYPSPYFFSSKIFIEHGASFEFIEFEKIYRQRDLQFINILNAIRNNTVTAAHLEALNARLKPDFVIRENEFWVQITGTNEAVRKINDAMLEKIKGKEQIFEAQISGDIKKESFPTDEILKLKIGAQVMMVNNDSEGRWVNGTIGQIVGIKNEADDSAVILVELNSGETVRVSSNTWKVFKYEIDKNSNALTTTKIGSFEQYPLRLAWALTVHKSQGKTFANVVIDIDRTFAPGQMYVALSRCISLDGLILRKKIAKSSIFIDYRVVDFLTKFQYQKSENNLSFENKMAMIKDAILKKQFLEITYLKAQDEKSKRIIQPLNVGEMFYQDKKFIGMEGFCTVRKEQRSFRVDRILEMQAISNLDDTMEV